MKKLKPIFLLFIGALIFTACEETLDLELDGQELTAQEVLSDPAQYTAIFAKVYAGLHTGGQEAGDGNTDITGINGGFGNYSRIMWYMQELTSDEALIGWNDGTIQDLQRQTWNDGNEFIAAWYSRVSYQIALANDFLRIATDENFNEYNIPAEDRAVITSYREEVRFLRALSYYHAMDSFGAIGYQDETTDPTIGGERFDRQQIFNYVESELLDIENTIAPVGTNPYGRADQGAVWMLLAKIYMNSEVYTGTPRYAEALDYTNRVINSGVYSISNTQPYSSLMLADNDSNGVQSEFIWTLNFDGLRTQSYNVCTVVTHASIGGNMQTADFGVNAGWAGLRTTPQFVEIFPGEENSDDGRAQFFTQGQSKVIPNQGDFQDGFAIAKFRNVDVNGDQGRDTSGEFVDIDFPMFRLGDAYLMYAEAHLRGGGGDASTAVNYINILRERAYGDSSGNITTADLDLEFILDERGRELHWEAHRRQDLVRFNQFTANKRWAWKGNVQNGTTTPVFRNIFPIPAEQINLNTNLVQNPGY
jgi:hypothetical protein